MSIFKKIKNPVIKDNYFYTCTKGANIEGSVASASHINNFYRGCTTSYTDAAYCKLNTENMII